MSGAAVHGAHGWPAVCQYWSTRLSCLSGGLGWVVPGSRETWAPLAGSDLSEAGVWGGDGFVPRMHCSGNIYERPSAVPASWTPQRLAERT